MTGTQVRSPNSTHKLACEEGYDPQLNYQSKIVYESDVGQYHINFLIQLYNNFLWYRVFEFRDTKTKMVEFLLSIIDNNRQVFHTFE